MFPAKLPKFVWYIGYAVIGLTASALPALALNPTYRLSQYNHTAWGSNSGVQAVRRINQTSDGYLWLATRGGLVRFDGVRFLTFKGGSEEGFKSSTVQDLVVDQDGSLWIATLGGGIAHYQAGKFRSYTVSDGLPSNDISSLYRDSSGTLWVGTRGAGIARMVNGKFEKLSLAIPSSAIGTFLEGPDHALWIATYGYGVFRLRNGTISSLTVKDGLPDNRVVCLYRDHSGTIWTAGWRGVSSWNGTTFIGRPAINAVVTYAISVTEDRDGNFWIASSAGLFRAHAGEVTRMDRKTGLSGDFVSDVFEDKEGNLWVGTRGGIDRFRSDQIRTFDHVEGTPGPIVANDQGVWMASNRNIVQVASNTIGTRPWSLPKTSVALTMLSKPDGLLIGFTDGLRSWSNSHARVALELSGLDVHALLRASDGSIWIGTANRGLLRWLPSEGPQRLLDTGVPDRFITTLAQDRTGVIWAGSFNGGGLYRLAGGKVQHFGRDEGLSSPSIYTIFLDEKDEPWIGSAGGLSWFHDGHIRTVNSQQGLPADQVFAILGDSYDRLWFTGYGGIASISKKSLTGWAAGRIRRVDPALYRVADGQEISAFGRFFPNAARTVDGHLWFSIADGLCEVTPLAPLASQFPVVVEEVNIDRVHHAAPRSLRMSPGTRSIEIRYTALALSNSEAIRFRYRLEGIDNDWVEADTRRVAFYNNLKPGAYNFLVAASSGEEQWQQSSSLILEQLPFFYQTWWFMVLASVAVLSLVIFLERLRVRQAVDRVQAGFEQRIDERTRIARELHDTLLQSFQGLMLRLQAVNELLPEGKAKGQLERTLLRADQALVEGRKAVYDLRSSATVASDLGEAVSALGEELATGDSPAFRLVVEGRPRDLNPIIRDELYRLTREALRNAFTHSQAKNIEAELTYEERALRLRIRDDGGGIPSEIVAEGRPGHYGLSGMRERAEQIGATLVIWSKLGAGTEIDLNVPASVAYDKQGRRFFPPSVRAKMDSEQ